MCRSYVSMIWSIIMNYKYTAEELLSQPETFELMVELGNDVQVLCSWIKDLHAKTKNYKEHTYYHVITPKYDKSSMSGVGEGLYLGKDYKALANFYGLDYIDNNEEVPIQTYYGNPNFMDLTNKEEYKIFEEFAKEGFPNEKNNNELKEMTLKLGYDGIRYYDAIATGEEFVLYNIDKLKLIKTENIKINKKEE